jgi:peptidoglycan/xylan/chitin deacetylase (PgdA/CDA1 family)
MSNTKNVLLTVNVHGVGPEAASMPETELYGRFGHGRYTYGVGLRRILDMLRRQRVQATFFWPVFEAMRSRDLLDQCLADGHEVASQGNAFEDLSKLGAAEGETLERARDALAALTGEVPLGFRYAAGAFSSQTMPLLSKLGYRYDSSAIDDDTPYSLSADGGGNMIELPWSEGLTDATHFSHRVTQNRAFDHFVEQFDALIAVDGYACFTFHPRADIGVGRAARLVMVEDLLGHVREKGKVEFKQCRDVALAT